MHRIKHPPLLIPFACHKTSRKLLCHNTWQSADRGVTNPVPHTLTSLAKPVTLSNSLMNSGMLTSVQTCRIVSRLTSFKWAPDVATTRESLTPLICNREKNFISKRYLIFLSHVWFYKNTFLNSLYDEIWCLKTTDENRFFQILHFSTLSTIQNLWLWLQQRARSGCSTQDTNGCSICLLLYAAATVGPSLHVDNCSAKSVNVVQLLAAFQQSKEIPACKSPVAVPPACCQVRSWFCRRLWFHDT